jgi:hypothetical protein
MSHIFISFDEQDISFARYLKRQLQAEGFTVWMDETGDEFNEDRWLTIEASIYSSFAFLPIMTSQAQRASRVRRELQAAHQFDKPIFPILLGNKPWAQVTDLEYFDMTTGLDSALPMRLISRLVGIVPLHSPSLVLPPARDGDSRNPGLADATADVHHQVRDWIPGKTGLRIAVVVVAVAVVVTLVDFGDRSDPVDEELRSSTITPQQSTEGAAHGTESPYTVQVETNTAHTETVLTAVSIATLGTATPTIDYRGTVDARFTATKNAADAQLAQAALVMSATAAVQSATAETMRTQTATVIAALLRVLPAAPTPTLGEADSVLPSTTTVVPLSTDTVTLTPDVDAVVPNEWIAGSVLYIQGTTGISQYAGQEPDRPDQFQAGDIVTVGLGNIAPGKFREWYVVPATQERWWFVDYLGGGWLPEGVLGDTPPEPANTPPNEGDGTNRRQ